jgi:uncharacterized repeat protein (TIGR01451 family)
LLIFIFFRLLYSPVEDADIYIDYQNKGFNISKFPVKALQSIRVSDPVDKDMSGASIFAVKNGTGIEGPPVDIAVAWGQDPAVSRPNQPISMDMGTVTLPFTNVKVAKLVSKVFINAGDELLYTIRVANVGQKQVYANDLTVKDSLDSDVTYIPGSTVMKYMFGGNDIIAIPDGATGTKFPLDEEGFVIPTQIPRRGGSLDISFKVKVAPTLSENKSKVVNSGFVKQKVGLDLPFEATSFVIFKASVAVANTVLLGLDGTKCSTSQEIVAGKFGSNVTYCFKVTNNGLAHLINVKLVNDDIGGYIGKVNKTLAPGESATVFTSGKILAAGINNVVVTAQPAFPNGVEISDASAVTATDPSEVQLVAFLPKITVDNRVYIGNDGKGAKCNTTAAVESVSDIFNTPVTYCFIVTNNGDTWLNGITLQDAALAYSGLISGSMAPGAKQLIYVSGSIKQDLLNNVVVTGVPILSDGTRIVGADTVTNEDPSAVVKLGFKPSIVVDNTVYLGKDGGKKCNSSAAVNFVADYFNNPATYCFKITNTGETTLMGVTLVNPALAYINLTIGKLASGASIILYQERTIAKALINVANVTGTPVMADGRALSDLSNVTWSDPSEVGVKDNRPGVSIKNTVVLGHDGGCGTSAANETVQGYPGSKVTYCFDVKNIGDSYLDNITLTNEKLAYSTSVPMLAPGVSTIVTIQRTITSTLENIVKVVANPTLQSGVDIPGQPDVSATDPSGVILLEYKPAVSVANTVYRGSSESKACGTSVETVEGKFGDDVTYCFYVTNSGNTYLKDFKIDNADLSFKDNISIKSLAPGQSQLVFVGGQILKSFGNTVTVTATPTKDNGDILAIPDVKSTDPSSVTRIAHKPSIKIDNKVYVGSVDNKLCDTDKAMEVVRDIYMTDVVYCLKVSNNGETYLNKITIEDNDLEFKTQLDISLAPNATELVVVPGQILSDLKNKAVVTANPILKDGRDIEGIPDVSSFDESEVNKLVFVPTVQVDNTVYKGNDGGKSCQTATESVQDLYGTEVTYCFKVTNMGTTSLKNVVLSNEELVYAFGLDTPLKPGDSKLLTFPSKISTASINTLNVTATPIMTDGRALLDLEEVSDSDPSGVTLLPHSPSLTISNTVYLGGSDNGAKCSTAVETVEDKYGAAVTYCFKIQNTGNTHLQSVTLFDNEVKLGNTLLGVLAPGETTTFSVEGKINADLRNEAVVTGIPSLKDGDNIPGVDNVVAKDPSSVKLVAFQPTINIENTVYIGADSGASCDNSKLELVSGYPKTAVVYCLQVINTGDSYLSNVVIVDEILKVNDSSIKLLAPGASKMIPVSGLISGNGTNIAKVTAAPSLADGTAVPNAAAVTDSDPSGVAQLAYAPAVKIDNVIGLGRSCASARELAEGFYGDEITYCFIVTNRGDTILSKITITDDAINYSGSVSNALAPGESVTVSVPSTITGDFINVAVVTATPVNKDMSPIDGLGQVKNQDPSETNKFDLVGGITIVNTVYDNSIPGSTCEASADSIEGKYGTPSTYCFKISNTGETHLNNVVVTDTELNYKSGPIKTLAPGESIVLSVPTTITSTLKNTAVVTGNPITEAGKDIVDLKDVRNEDASTVTLLESKADVSISNKVYKGVDGGVSCGTSVAVESVEGFFGTNITYCLEVTNIGETSLTQISIVDKELELLDNTIKKLAPGESVTIPVQKKITASLTNNAVVTGIPSLKDGTAIPGMAPVTATDPSSVVRTAYIPSIDVINTVYLGGANNNNGLSSCGTAAAVDHVEHYEGAVVTYCFEVTNKGNSYLNNVVVVDQELKFSEKLVKPLAPGESITIAYPSTIFDTLKNTAVVTANPVIADGTDIPDATDVTWSDSSSVGKLVYFPSISIDNRVYIGDDNGASCATAVESVTGREGTDVIYCFNITNTGDTYLSDIDFKDTELSYDDTSIAILPPKGSKLLVFLSKITTNLTNHAVVVANPTLADGADIAGALDVTATDPSNVILKKGIDGDVRAGEKTPYSPPTNSTKCIQDNWKAANHTDDLVCASKEVYIDTISSDKPLTCTPGETITLTVDATVQIAGPRNDVGWYIAADGGDALTGKCIVNGFQNNGAKYSLVNANSQSAGFVQWIKADGHGDGDQCGDVVIVNDGSAKSTFPIMVNATLPCTDDNDDGAFDFAVCFTWKTDATNAVCNLSTNIPGTNCGCFCTRIDVPNVEVTPTPVDPIAAC